MLTRTVTTGGPPTRPRRVRRVRREFDANDPSRAMCLSTERFLTFGLAHGLDPSVELALLVGGARLGDARGDRRDHGLDAERDRFTDG